MKRIEGLDGLRCISIIPVILLHVGVFSSGPMGFIASHGWMGVDLFFVISGYLITTILVSEMDRTGTISLRGFYARRFLRIFPAYYLLVFGYLIAAALISRTGVNPFNLDVENVAKTIIYPATYLTNIYVSLSGTEHVVLLHSWSLSLEEQFYFIWPMVLLLMPRHALRVAIATIVGCTLWRVWLVFHIPEGIPAMVRIFYGVDTRIDTILYGVVLALVLKRDDWRARLEQVYRRFLFLPVVALLFAVTAFQSRRWSGYFGNSLGYGCSAFLMANLVGYVVIIKSRYLLRFLELKPLVHIGKISYGMYLYHGLVIDGLFKLMPQPSGIVGKFGVSALAIGVTVGVASLSFYFFEQPILQMKTKLRKSNEEKAISLSKGL